MLGQLKPLHLAFRLVSHQFKFGLKVKILNGELLMDPLLKHITPGLSSKVTQVPTVKVMNSSQVSEWVPPFPTVENGS